MGPHLRAKFGLDLGWEVGTGALQRWEFGKNRGFRRFSVLHTSSPLLFLPSPFPLFFPTLPFPTLPFPALSHPLFFHFYDMKGNAKICKNFRLEPPFGDLGVTHRVHLWLDGKRIVDYIQEEWCSYTTVRGSFYTKKRCSRLRFHLSWILLPKQQNRVLCHPLGNLMVTYTVHLSLVGKRVVDFLLVLIEHFSLAVADEALWADIGRIVVFERGWVTLSANISGNEPWGVAHQR